VPGRELVDKAVQVLRADVVESPVVTPLQGGPEALHAVRVRLIPDVFADAVPHGFVLAILHAD